VVNRITVVTAVLPVTMFLPSVVAVFESFEQDRMLFINDLVCRRHEAGEPHCTQIRTRLLTF
jgi:hypothetical protein